MKAITLERLTKYIIINRSTLDAMSFWYSKTGMNLEQSRSIVNRLRIDLKNQGLLKQVLEEPDPRDNSSDYLRKQEAWISYYNVKVGDKVRIIEKPIEYCGWSGTWISSMDDGIGKITSIRSMEKMASGIKLSIGSQCVYPYFVLEKVE